MVKKPEQHGKSQAPLDLDSKKDDQELEVESAALEGEEKTSKQTGDQSTIGNAAIAAMLASSPPPEDGGVVMSAFRQEEDKDTELSHGGDGEPAPNKPLQLTDLTASWRPRRRRPNKPLKHQDESSFADAPEDNTDDLFAAFVSKIQRLDAPTLPPATHIDSLLQPSARASTHALTRWATESVRWGGDSPLDLVLQYSIVNPPDCFQDFRCVRTGDGALRVATLAIDLLRHSPALFSNDHPANVAPISFCMELSARGYSTQQRTTIANTSPGADQLAAADQYASWWRTTHPQTVSFNKATANTTTLIAILNTLIDVPDSKAIIPNLAHAPEKKTADPLGLDATLFSFTGDSKTTEDIVYEASLAATERFASATTNLLRSLAAVAYTISEVTSLWSQGAPHTTIGHILRQADQAASALFSMLLEMATASRKQNITLKGLSNGFHRASTMFDQIKDEALLNLALTAEAILPSTRHLHFDKPYGLQKRHPLLFVESQQEVLDFFSSLPPSRETQLAKLLTKARSSTTTTATATALLNTPLPNKATLSVGCWQASLLLQKQRYKQALAVSRDTYKIALSRRNGVAVAALGLTIADAVLYLSGQEAAVDAHLNICAHLYHMGAAGPLKLVSEWQPNDCD